MSAVFTPRADAWRAPTTSVGSGAWALDDVTCGLRERGTGSLVATEALTAGEADAHIDYPILRPAVRGRGWSAGR